jgi:hypothetical protein
MWETLLGKLLGWIPSPWSGVRLGHEESARLCTDGHPMVWFVSMEGPQPPWPKAPLHIHAGLMLWSRTEHRTTVRKLKATAAGQQLVPEFKEMTLDPGAKPEEQSVQLEAPKGEELKARPGDTVTFELLLTRGRTRKLKTRIEPEKED